DGRAGALDVGTVIEIGNENVARRELAAAPEVLRHEGDTIGILVAVRWHGRKGLFGSVPEIGNDRCLFGQIRHGLQRTEEAMRRTRTGAEVRGQARREEQRVRGAGGAAVAELERPQVFHVEGLSRTGLQFAEEFAGCRIEGVDISTAEVADQQIVAEGTEVRGGLRDAPWIVELATRD